MDVYQNGVKLGDADYTATSGTSIVLGTGASASDLVVIVVFDVFSVADTVSKADGGTFDGNVTMAGTLDVTGAITSSAGATITTADNTTQLTLKSTDTDSGVGLILSLSRDNDSADNDLIGQIHFFAEHDGNSQHKYSEIFCQIVDATDGSEDGRLYFNVSDGGSNREFMRMTGSEGIVINEEGDDLDFRIESDTNANAFFS